MKINGHYPVDVATVLPTYQKEGLAEDLLRRCNAQSFKLIGGAGEGYFLLTNDQDFSDGESGLLRTVSLTITDTNDPSSEHDYSVIVLDVLRLNHPSQTDTYLTVVHTAEEKYKLKNVNVSRNYNLINRSSISSAVDMSEITYQAPDDVTQPTLEAIIGDISGLSVTYTGPTITPYEVNLQGMNALDAIDLLCAVYGFCWTVWEDILYVFATTTPGTIPADFINDIRLTELPKRLYELQYVGPIVSNVALKETRHGGKFTAATGPGETLTIYNPFLPTILKADGTTFLNNTALQDLATSQFDYFDTIVKIKDSYLVRNHFDTSAGVFAPFYSTACFTLTFADYGAGPRTLYSSTSYPIPTVSGLESPSQSSSSSSSEGATVVWAIFELTNVLPAGIDNTSSAADVISHNDLDNPSLSTITVVNSGESKGYVGCRGMALKVLTAPATYEWRVIWIQQPALRVRVVLAGYPAAGIPSTDYYAADPKLSNAGIKTASPAPVVLTPFPFDFLPTQDDTVPNPLKLLGRANDTAIMAWDKDTEDYYLEEICEQQQTEFWATYAADHPDGLQQSVSLHPDNAGSDGAMPADPFSATDHYNVGFNAKEDQRCLVKYDYKNGYILVLSEHNAWELIGTLNGSFSASDPTFSVNVTAILDGISPGSPIEVRNKFNWPSGTTGNVVRCKWDPIAGEYYADQMEWVCP